MIGKSSRCLASKGMACQHGQAEDRKEGKRGQESKTRKQSRLRTYLEIEILPPSSADLEFPSRRSFLRI